MTRVRLDILLVQKGLCASLEIATALIMSGRVRLRDTVFAKPGQLVDENLPLELQQKEQFVSRGGYKLQGALDAFGCCFQGKIAMDVGASTGGFTDCLLQHGVQKVTCVDVGYGLLEMSLRNDPRVVVKEKMNARYITAESFDEPFDLITIDVSFISQKKILPALMSCLNLQGQIISLVKPQFEVNKHQVGKGGVVRDEKIILETVEDIIRFSETLQLKLKATAPSVIKGPAGNQEYFIWLEKNN